MDADKLEYISSAGLRVILRLRKEEPKLAIINVDADVYEVFDMTGFTDMVTIEKAYKRMSVEGCEFIAKGANGAVYRYDSETILKTYFAKDALPEIKQERENARRAFVLGINTAIPYGIVRVGDNYGTITELTLRVATCQVDFYSESEAGFMRADSLVTFIRGTQGASWFRQWSIGSLYCDDVQQMDYTDGEKYQVMQSIVTLRLAYWSGLTSKLQFFDDVKVSGVNPDIVLDKQNL